jgi:septal ring factor EnvC (AmiA/AmiB activator)
MERYPRVLFAVLVMLAGSLQTATAEPTREEANAQLEEVRDRIDGLREEIQSDGRRRSRAEKALAKAEREEQAARRELSDVRKKLDANRKRQKELEQQLETQQAELAHERRMLSQQVRVAYINGNEEWLRVVLSQKDVETIGRRMTYYGYLSRQRSNSIENLLDLLVQLEETRVEIAAQAKQLVRLEAEAAGKLEDIADARAERSRMVARIKKEMEGKDAEIKRLLAQEKELGQLVERLAKVLPQMPNLSSEPFAGQAAKLSWPASGQVLKNFGEPRADGSLKWQGVLLSAKAGSDVRAVYHGRVVFSDWLDGMGLLMIIEHGDGYMSLYGHNQDLLRDVGEWVEPNDVIAHVGDSGGKAAAGLYFEIRKNGEPVNPRRWIR